VTTQPMDVPKKMGRYCLVLVSKGKNWQSEWPDLQRRHLAFNRRMVEAGKFLLFGPLLEDIDLRAAAVVNTASPAEAAAVIEGDPAIVEGHFAYEVHPIFWPALDSVVVEY
jgi:uncharacterized protein YciI